MELEVDCSSNIWFICSSTALAVHIFPGHFDNGSISFQTFSKVFDIKNAHASRTIERSAGKK